MLVYATDVHIDIRNMFHKDNNNNNSHKYTFVKINKNYPYRKICTSVLLFTWN